MYFVYILRCTDGSLYTGITSNINKRVQMHTLGKGSKYVRSRLPVTLVYKEELLDKSTALKRELAIKSLTKQEKLQIIHSYQINSGLSK